MATVELVAEKKTTTSWYIGETTVVTENRDGTYTIIDYYRLDESGLKRVHAVLGQMLVDMAMNRLEEVKAS